MNFDPLKRHKINSLGGRYQILTQLGQGGFGRTFLAQDTQSPGNPQCVVKHFTHKDEGI